MPCVALAMIVRDEARCLARCLASVRPFVDRMVVLDTGSVDATPAIARAAGAEVHTFDWVDDFSAARNRALALADADWCVVLDADEWLAEGGEALAALRHTPPGFVGQVRVDSEFDADRDAGRSADPDATLAVDVAVAPSWLARVLPRGVHFAGRIHEHAEPGLPRRRLDVRFGHDGYRAALRPAKRGRNERLLRLALAERPNDAYLQYQLAKDLELNDCYAQAVVLFEAAHAQSDAAVAWRHDLLLRFVHALKRTRQWERAVALAEAEMPHWPHSPDFYFALGDLLLDWAAQQPARADELLPMIEASWLQCLSIGENDGLEGAVQGRGSFLAAHNLAAFHASLGHASQAAHFERMARELRAASRSRGR